MPKIPPKTKERVLPTIRGAIEPDTTKLMALLSRLSRDEPYLVVSGVDEVTGVPLGSDTVSADEQRASSEIFVAEVDKELAGIAICRCHPAPERNTILQLDMGVDAAYRRRGLGDALTCHVVEWARETDIHRIQLAVVAENRAALSLYEKHGFVTEGILRRGFRLASNFHDVHVMARLLK
jgi:ribosomal protein S18 acetylase RimI-like enzyme